MDAPEAGTVPGKRPERLQAHSLIAAEKRSERVQEPLKALWRCSQLLDRERAVSSHLHDEYLEARKQRSSATREIRDALEEARSALADRTETYTNLERRIRRELDRLQSNLLVLLGTDLFVAEERDELQQLCERLELAVRSGRVRDSVHELLEQFVTARLAVASGKQRSSKPAEEPSSKSSPRMVSPRISFRRLSVVPVSLFPMDPAQRRELIILAESLDPKLTEPVFNQLLKQPAVEVVVAKAGQSDGPIDGFVLFQACQESGGLENLVTLLAFGVRNSMQRCGVGTQLLTSVIERFGGRADIAADVREDKEDVAAFLVRNQFSPTRHGRYSRFMLNMPVARRVVAKVLRAS